MLTTSRSAIASRALLGAASLLWLAAVVLPPTTRGVGAALPGHGLADLIGSGVVVEAVPRWLGPAWYAMPLGAAVVLVALGLDGARATVVRGAAASVALVSAVGFSALLTGLEVDRMGAGSWCGIVGAACALAAAGIGGARCLTPRRESHVL